MIGNNEKACFFAWELNDITGRNISNGAGYIKAC